LGLARCAAAWAGNDLGLQGQFYGTLDFKTPVWIYGFLFNQVINILKIKI
jgi:hypothetical protein